MPKAWQKWMPNEDKELVHHWQYSDMETLLNTFPRRSYNSLMLRARVLGVTSKRQRKRIGSFDFLNNITPNSAYWWGFIMADGHLSKANALIIQLSAKDKTHLEKLSSKLGVKIRDCESPSNAFTNEPSSFCRLFLQDKDEVTKWKLLLGISGKKTYEPPTLDMFFTEQLFAPFFVGFIDGDGCIWNASGFNKQLNYPNIKIEVHKSWLGTLSKFKHHLSAFYQIAAKVLESKKGTAVLSVNGRTNELS